MLARDLNKPRAELAANGCCSQIEEAKLQCTARLMVNPLSTTPDVVRMAAFYPGKLLVDQLKACKRLTSRCVVHVSFDSGPSAIRRTLLGTDVVLIDATLRPGSAELVLREAVQRPGGYCTAVYSELTQHRLESLVRQQGSWFLLGPMSLAEWESVLESMFAYVGRVQNLPAAGVRPGRRAA